MRLPIYLDYMATTPVDPRVAAKMQHYLTIDGVFGNAASQHHYGLQANAAIEEARQQVAALVNASPESIIWTSGATESNNLALKGAAYFYKRQGTHIITAKTEHSAVLDTCKYLETQGFSLTYLTPKSDGLLDLTELQSALRPDTILVSIMHANNEIGVIQDIAAIGEIVRERGILLHVDAAQSAGKIPIDLQKLKVDLMSFSSHKIYGPKGVGALYIRPKPHLHLEPQMHGGSQEKNIRAGTLATHQIVGMGEAFYLASQEMAAESVRLQSLREKFWNGIKDLTGLTINGSIEQRLPGNLNISFAGISSEILLIALKDLAVSTASACHKAAITPSHVLQALGVPAAEAINAIRFSFGRFTTTAEIDYAIDYINKTITTLRADNDS